MPYFWDAYDDSAYFYQWGQFAGREDRMRFASPKIEKKRVTTKKYSKPVNTRKGCWL